MRSRASSDVMWLGFAELASRASTFGIFILAARLLNTQELASYLILFSLSGLIWVGAQLGTGIYGVKELCQCNCENEKSARIISSMLLIRLSLTVGAFIIVLFLRNVFFPGESFEALIVAFILVLLRAITLDWVLRAYNKSRLLSFYTIFSSFTGLGVAYIVLTNMPTSVMALWAHVLPLLLLCIATWVIMLFVVGVVPAFGKSTITSSVFALRKCSVIGFAGIAVMSSQTVPLFSLNYFATPSDVALFGSMQRMLQIALGGVLVLSMAHFPALSRSVGVAQLEKGSFIHYLSDLILVALGIYILMLTEFGQFALSILGEQFVSNGIYVVLVFSILPIYFVRTAFTDTLIAHGKAKYVMVACLIGLLVSLILAFAWLPIVASNTRVESAILVLGFVEASIFGVSVWAVKIYLGTKFFREIYVRLLSLIVLFACGAWIVLNVLNQKLDHWLIVVVELLFATIAMAYWLKGSTMWFMIGDVKRKIGW